MGSLIFTERKKGHMDYMKDFGGGLLRNGFNCLPIPHKSRHVIEDFRDTVTTPELLDIWTGLSKYTNSGIALRGCNTPAIDLDVFDQVTVDKLLSWIKNNIGNSVIRIGRAPRALLVFNADTSILSQVSNSFIDEAGYKHNIEIIGKGRTYHVYGIHYLTKKPYYYLGKELKDIKKEELAPISVADITALFDYFYSIIPSSWSKVSSSSVIKTQPPEDLSELAFYKPPENLSEEEIKKKLCCINPDLGYAEWIRVGMSLHHEMKGSERGLSLWVLWSKHADKYKNFAELHTYWRGFKNQLSDRDPITIKYLDVLGNDPLYQWEEGIRKTTDRSGKKASDFYTSCQDFVNSVVNIEWLLEGFLSENTTSVIFGAPGSYKSFVAVDIALHIASGESWRGLNTEKGKVVYIAGEGNFGIKKRVKVWLDYHKKEIDIPFYLSHSGHNLFDKRVVSDQIQALKEIHSEEDPIKLIVIDTLAKNFHGDENKSSDMNRFVNHVDGMIREAFNCHVMIIHHTGKGNSSSPRGSNVLDGGVDCTYLVEHEEDIVTISNAKSPKDFEAPENMFFKTKKHSSTYPNGEIARSIILEETEEPIKGFDVIE